VSLELTDLLAAAVAVYGLGGALSILLQARQMLVRRASCDVSLRFLSVYVVGYAIWLLYGLSLGNAPIVLVNALGLVCGTMTLTVGLPAPQLSVQARRPGGGPSGDESLRRLTLSLGRGRLFARTSASRDEDRPHQPHRRRHSDGGAIVERGPGCAARDVMSSPRIPGASHRSAPARAWQIGYTGSRRVLQVPGRDEQRPRPYHAIGLAPALLRWETRCLSPP
jgi:uncharacterized protein with PQ loop repeat